MKIINFDINKTLGDLDYNRKSSIVSRAHKLRQKPVKDLTTEELRLMIHQNNSLKFLVPLAIDRLNIDSLLKGEGYEGDLLNAVLTVEKKFWVDDLRQLIPFLEMIIKAALKLANADPEKYKKFLLHCGGAIHIFKLNVGIA